MFTLIGVKRATASTLQGFRVQSTALFKSQRAGLMTGNKGLRQMGICGMPVRYQLVQQSKMSFGGEFFDKSASTDDEDNGNGD